MVDYRYDTRGSWFKGNCHIHSTASDGGKTLAELMTLFADMGEGVGLELGDRIEEVGLHALVSIDAAQALEHVLEHLADQRLARGQRLALLRLDGGERSQARPGTGGAA